MNELIRAALVIARRDYVATVWSKSFLLFLVGPFFPLLVGAIFAIVGAGSGAGTTPVKPPVAVIAAPAEGAAIEAALGHLATTLAPSAPPRVQIVAPDGSGEAQARRLLAGPAPAADVVLVAEASPPLLIGAPDRVAATKGWLSLLVDEAGKTRALARDGRAWTPVTVATQAVSMTAAAEPVDHRGAAKAGQTVLLFLTLILTGMLLSNMIEEKSNKVIEVLAAAVPVDAIFIGKLVAMLGMSLTGIAIWASLGGLGLAAITHGGAVPLGLLPAAPAIGWARFVGLGIVYFVAGYLLLGAVLLGIGAQASTVREVQTMSMPITMGQIVVFLFASFAVADPNAPLALTAEIFPWSSPFAMLARAAQDGALWPHVVAIVWQALWVAIIVRFAAGRFRRSVLNVRTSSRKRLFARAG